MKKWVLPVNAKKYDVTKYLKLNDTFVWKAKKRIGKDDIVYIYATTPIQEIRYKCICIDDEVSKETLNEHSYAKEKSVTRYAMFKVIEEYPKGKLIWAELHKNGLGQALLPSRVYSDLEEFINSKE